MTVLMSNEQATKLNQLLTFQDVVKQVTEKVAAKEGWRNVENTIKQAMYRKRLVTANKRMKGTPPTFTQDSVDQYLEYLATRPRQGGASKAHNLEQFKPLLGLKTDSTIAELAQCSQNTVYKYRASLGIDSTRNLTGKKKQFAKILTESDLALVGMTMAQAQKILAPKEAK
jgi:hypothetical protein